MAGSPSGEPGERHSRKRRVSQITPDKSKKPANSLSPTLAEANSNKTSQMDPSPSTTKPSAVPEVSVTKGLAKPNDKTEGPAVDASAKAKTPKPAVLMKTKNKSEKATGKDKKPDEKENVAAKKDDGKGKKNDSKENKEDAKDQKPDTKENKDIKEAKLDTKEKSTKAPGVPKAGQGVKLPGLVQPVASDSEDSSDDDINDSDDSSDSNDSCDSDDSSEDSDSEDPSYLDDYSDEDLFEEVKVEYDEFAHMSPDRLAEEKAKTLRQVQTFIDNSKDKHYHEFPLESLTGPTNYSTWILGMEILLRMHQVWPVVGEPSVPLDKDHEMYPWYEHMVSVAVSLIYGHVSPELRSQRCFMASAIRRSPSMMMQHLWAHFSKDDDSLTC
ncbi:uncharacterized protein N7496_008848 [Penicillium cataractarum]|uniref:Uncharacterized protein n=1 Tax=Penicillium cataractarum TaxID=2100454 RepID=A0A9W9S3U0_9EURO|nr:uncharacterized protein N7496_008848 [Penicillium cataractarum]KAJ5369088.1 hypothetical protein N7496_008848 [Penicillium cataractarum]